MNDNIQHDTDGEPEEYKLFVEKFKPKKTTDDCYTPPEVYEAVKQWVLEEVPEIRELRIVRPFYPGGDYKAEDYSNAVVIDNPPFSILAEIKRFYLEQDVPFFLFAPALTLLSSGATRLTSIVAKCEITYHNGARVSTSFVSNLFGNTALVLAPEIDRMVKKAQKEANPPNTKPRYEYPPNVVTGAILSKYISRGVSLRIPREETHFTEALDSQRKVGKKTLRRRLHHQRQNRQNTTERTKGATHVLGAIRQRTRDCPKTQLKRGASSREKKQRNAKGKLTEADEFPTFVQFPQIELFRTLYLQTD